MSDGLETPRPGWKRGILWIAVLMPMLYLAAGLALESDGVYHDDDLMHYLMARWSWSDPVFLLHDWGRPGFTAPYALVAWIGDYEQGFMVCRFLTLGLAAASAWLASAVADRCRVHHAWTAGVALLAMPLYFRLSFATLTETICGFYLILGTWLIATSRFRAAAIVLALAPLARHEAVVFLVPVAMLFAVQKRWLPLFLLGWAELAWNVLSLKWYWMLPIQRYFHDKPIERYGEGGLLHYFLLWGHVSMPVLVAFTLAGAALAACYFWKRWTFSIDGQSLGLQTIGRRIREMTGVDFAVLYCVLGALGMVALQTALYCRNTFASGGYARFLLPAGPWMAVLIALALDPVLLAAVSWQARIKGTRRAALRVIGVGIAVGIAAIWLATRADLPKQSEWMIRGLYSGWQGLYLDRFTWWLFASGILLALWPRPIAATAVLGLAVWWGGNLWWETRQALPITPGERLIKMGIDAAQSRAAERGGKAEVRGQSPWVDYYLQRDGKTSDPSPADWWLNSQPGESKYLLLDNDYTPAGELREKLDQVPHDTVFSNTLRDTFPEAYQYWYAVDVLERR